MLFKKAKVFLSEWNQVGLIVGIGAFLLILIFFNPVPSDPLVGKMTAVVALMAIWWISNAIPLAATSLLPLVLFPLLGIMKGKELAPSYINSTIFLFIGGFLIALAMERWDLHRRIALRVLSYFGHSASTLVLGFMVATAFLSAWISNTATTIAMMPVGLAVISKIEAEYGREGGKKLGVCLMLGIAYAASIGGIATVVGTPPNLVFRTILSSTFPDAPSISFGQWALIGMPLSLVMLFVTWLILTRLVFPLGKDLKIEMSIIEKEVKSLGRIAYEEKVVLGVFVMTALLWLFRQDLVLGFFTLPGWENLLNPEVASLIDDGTIAIAMALILFLWPAKSTTKENKPSRIADEAIFKKVPWGIILLFGGGFALAKGFVESGLSNYLALTVFSNFDGLSTLVMVLIICTTMTFLTEFTSNTASTQLVLPILASAAVAQGVNPLALMLPATFAASMAFMMPVATPPNAIIFGSERVTIPQMFKAGFWINLLGIIGITLVLFLFAELVFQFESTVLPSWATLP